jgi:hypothetical protein
MDILNWLYTKAAGLVKTKANDPNTDLIALGANVGFNRRDDQYQTYGMTLKNCVQSGCTGNTKHYELDRSVETTVTVNTTRGIIDIIGVGTSVPLTPDASYGSSVSFLINNPDLDLTFANRDNIYVQYSVYYKVTGGPDNTIPYLIATGASAGLEFTLYNASPFPAAVNNWTGDLYVYYELYTLN